MHEVSHQMIETANTQEDKPAQNAKRERLGEKAFKILFTESAKDDSGKPLLVLNEPEESFVYAEPTDPDFGISTIEEQKTESSDKISRVVWLPTQLKGGERAEQWLRQSGNKVTKIALKSAELYFSVPSALIICDESLLNDLIVLTSMLFRYEERLQMIESQIAGGWKTLKKDLRYTHQVGEKEVAEWQHVKDMTIKTGELRILLERLTPAYSNLSDSAPQAVQKLAAQIVEELCVEDRLEAASDRLEVFEDTYELANDRISEFSYFNIEAKLEIWIIVILVLELIFMLAEVLVSLLKT